MADKPKPKGIMEEFGWFIWGMVGIALMWFFSGGPQREVAHEGAFLKPLAPIDTGEAYGNYYAGSTNEKETLDLPESPLEIIRKAELGFGNFVSQVKDVEKIHLSSLLGKKLYFDGVANAKKEKVTDEFLRLELDSNAKTSTPISNLILRGTSLNTYSVIPKASELPLLGITTTKTSVSLRPGGKAVISSGRSPIGTSFRINMCTGYLDQFQKYVPELDHDCPSPEDEIERSAVRNDEICREFVEDLPRCRVYQGIFPPNISSACKSFVIEDLNYNSCSLSHKEDEDFYANEWRLYLDETTEQWAQKNEIIRLIDPKGMTVDAITY
jgi:hypothetical protein